MESNKSKRVEFRNDLQNRVESLLYDTLNQDFRNRKDVCKALQDIVDEALSHPQQSEGVGQAAEGPVALKDGEELSPAIELLKAVLDGIKNSGEYFGEEKKLKIDQYHTAIYLLEDMQNESTPTPQQSSTPTVEEISAAVWACHPDYQPTPSLEDGEKIAWDILNECRLSVLKVDAAVGTFDEAQLANKIAGAISRFKGKNLSDGEVEEALRLIGGKRTEGISTGCK